ncbi:MAG TPA: hypothetical protein VFP47_01390, partial [Pyrinomonadaceae bacterium]|nr:hypothetical protein [Pyrinomonadaceae bacterium]
AIEARCHVNRYTRIEVCHIFNVPVLVHLCSWSHGFPYKAEGKVRQGFILQDGRRIRAEGLLRVTVRRQSE